MLVLKRREGQWVEITHKSGDVLRVKLDNVQARPTNAAELVFDDAPRNFEIHRPERGDQSAGAVGPPKHRRPPRARAGDMREKVRAAKIGVDLASGPDWTAHTPALDAATRAALARLAGDIDWRERLETYFPDGLTWIKGETTLAVSVVAAVLAGATFADILKRHPDLEADDIRACLAWAIEAGEQHGEHAA